MREVIAIAFNEEEQGQANEELKNIDTASDKMMSNDQKENLNNKKDKAKNLTKKILKDPKVQAFIASNIVPILIVIGIILLILILVGQFAFFTTMPGMILEKIKEFGRSIWGDFVGYFTGDSITASVSEEDILNLAQYIENMGYDIESCGFGKAEYEEPSEEDESQTTKQLTSIGESADGKEYLKAYIAANEATYVLSSFSLNGFLRQIGSEFSAFIRADDSEVLDDRGYSTGMINILDSSGLFESSDHGYVEIDRQNEKMTVYTNATFIPFNGIVADWMGWTTEGYINWGSMFSYDLASWTSKYGKPVELFLSLHLSTMMPDLAYRVARDQELNTKVNLVLQDINVKYETTVRSVGDNDANITGDEIVNAFLNYGLTGEDHQYDEVIEEQTDEGETMLRRINRQNNFYAEILETLTTQDERNEFFRNIMEQASHHFMTDIFGINIANALIDDDEGWAISRYFERSLNRLRSIWERAVHHGESEYIVYIRTGSEEVPGLPGITYDDLLELANIVAEGLGDGIDDVKWPYIQSVTKHWYYNDIDFSRGVYRKASVAKKKIQYQSADTENSALVQHGIRVELDAELTADEGIVYQVCEPEATGPNEHILEIFNDKYYKYDGTIETAKKIENAKLYDKNGGAGEVDYNGETYTMHFQF